VGLSGFRNEITEPLKVRSGIARCAPIGVRLEPFQICRSCGVEVADFLFGHVREAHAKAHPSGLGHPIDPERIPVLGLLGVTQDTSVLGEQIGEEYPRGQFLHERRTGSPPECDLTHVPSDEFERLGFNQLGGEPGRR